MRPSCLWALLLLGACSRPRTPQAGGPTGGAAAPAPEGADLTLASLPDASVPALAQATRIAAPLEPPHRVDTRPIPGLDVSRITKEGDGMVAPCTAGTAHLTLDPDLQRTASDLMAAYRLPQAAIVMMDTATGRLLVYASHVGEGPARDVCAEAMAPSASVFKIVTAAALIEQAHLGPDTKQCYAGGGEQHINQVDLVDDPRRDRSCVTLGSALAHSTNTVFARLASHDLSADKLEAMAHGFGYGQAPVFDVPVQPSSVHVPSETLGLARTAAGFWNTTLTPIEAAQISTIVARGGESVQPVLVDRVLSATGAEVWKAPDAPGPQRVVARETADSLTRMMEQTVTEGTCLHAFHDLHGTAFLRSVPVAGKTGTLNDPDGKRFYTWFTGFAPARPDPSLPQVAIAVLVVNGPAWKVKANVLARDVLRAYFAERGASGVTQPNLSATHSPPLRRRSRG